MSKISCPSCGASSFVVDSRKTKRNVMRRRRQCKSCSLRWSTVEIGTDEYDTVMMARRNAAIARHYLEKYLRTLEGLDT